VGVVRAHPAVAVAVLDVDLTRPRALEQDPLLGLLELGPRRLHREPERVRHRRYQKTLQRTTRLYAHDEVNDLREGDRVRVQETRPTSKLKRWRVVEVLERAR